MMINSMRMPRVAAALLLAPALMLGLSGCHVVQSMHTKCCKKPQPVVAPLRTVTVTGEVRAPGVFDFPEFGGLTIQKAIALSGGMSPESLSLTGAGVASTGGTKAPDNGYAGYVQSRVVTLQREQVQYIIPAEILDSSEFGRIRLLDRDVVAVLPTASLLLDNNASEISKKVDILDQKEMSSMTVTINGTTTLEQSEFSNAELLRLTGYTIGKAPADMLSANTSDAMSGTMKKKDFRDWEQGPTFVRLTRYATVGESTQVFFLPLAATVALELKGRIYIRGGDMFTYLPPGLDPLVLSGTIAEAETKAAFERARVQATQSMTSVKRGRW